MDDLTLDELDEHARRVIAYWRKSLDDTDMMSSGLPERQEIPPTAIDHGAIYDINLVEKLFEAVYKRRDKLPPHLQADQPDIQAEGISVLLAPMIAQNQSRTVMPLLIPATLFADGSIGLHAHLLPWIPKRLLTPLPPDDVKIGAKEISEAFAARRADELRQADTRWSDVMAYAWDLLDTVGGEDWQTVLAEQGYRILQKAYAFPVVPTAGFNVNITRVYAALEAEERLPDLFKNYVAADRLPAAEPYGMPDWLDAAMSHLGAISAEFPLSPSQREALYNFLMLPPGTVLPINGPPGTGKTTLLQSVVASLWVEAALADGEPPLIAVSSTNNQAVTNVIESFGRLSTIERWLPVPSFGLYLVNSRDKQKQATEKGFLWTDRKGAGFHRNLLNGDLLARMTNQYLDRADAFFEAEFDSVEDAVFQLHNQLKRVAVKLHHGLQSAYAAAHAAEEQRQALAMYGNFATRRSFLAQALGEKSAEITTHNALFDAWQDHLNGIKWWQAPVGFVPSVKREHTERNAEWVRLHLPQFEGKPTTRAVNQWFENRAGALSAELEHLHGRRDAMQAEADGMNESQIAWDEWRQNVDAPDCDLALLFDPNVQTNPFFDWCDVTLRHELLQLATYYWEGRWLIETHAKGGDPDDERSLDAQLARWRRYAKLTPCFVTTMQTGPAFFEFDDDELGQRQPILNALDLLVVDEAGQVLPEVSGAMFALAQQALVVGDTKQIEPIWNVPMSLDEENLYEAGIIGQRSDMQLTYTRALRASRGSVMALAQFNAPFQKRPQQGIRFEPGMFLAEHRRSVPEVISYCNELAYRGALIPAREPIWEYPWPHMGMVPVTGSIMEMVGSSRRNLREAEAVMGWLNRNQIALEDYYDRDLSEIVAIITPFAAQKRTIRALLQGQNLGDMTVGTVHALQGGERPVVLFSSVYTAEHEGRFFFDSGVNMLNVAVSRAQDCFLVVGEPDIFDPESNTPSGLLARYIFQ